MSLTHVDDRGRPRMVDVGDKPVSLRRARAEAEIVFPPAVDQQLRAQGFAVAKGPVIATAIIAGVMGAKQTATLIPFCNPLSLDDCETRSSRWPRASGACGAACACRPAQAPRWKR